MVSGSVKLVESVACAGLSGEVQLANAKSTNGTILKADWKFISQDTKLEKAGRINYYFNKLKANKLSK